MVWDDDGNAYLDLVAASPRQAPRARPSGGGPRGVDPGRRRSATRPTWSPTRRRCALAERLLRPRTAGTAGLLLPTPAPRPTRPPSRWPGAPGARPWSPPRAPSMAARWARSPLTGQPAKRAPFEPLPGDVTFVPYGDAEALRAAVGPDGRVFLEPVHGEGGVVLAPVGYLEAARQVTRQLGLCPCSTRCRPASAGPAPWFAHQRVGVEPDVLTLAKGLAAASRSVPCIAFGDAASLLAPGQHGATFGGNPVSCAAALAVLDTIETRAWGAGGAAREGPHRRHHGAGHPLVRTVRGAGLMLGVVLVRAGRPRGRAAARERGFLVNAVAADVVRLVPPLVLTDDQVESFLGELPAILDAAAATVRETAGARDDPARHLAHRTAPAHRRADGERGPLADRAGPAARRRGRRRSPRPRCRATSTSSARSRSATATAACLRGARRGRRP